MFEGMTAERRSELARMVRLILAGTPTVTAYNDGREAEIWVEDVQAADRLTVPPEVEAFLSWVRGGSRNYQRPDPSPAWVEEFQRAVLAGECVITDEYMRTLADSFPDGNEFRRQIEERLASGGRKTDGRIM